MLKYLYTYQDGIISLFIASKILIYHENDKKYEIQRDKHTKHLYSSWMKEKRMYVFIRKESKNLDGLGQAFYILIHIAYSPESFEIRKG